jgi:hypothetical protein
VCSVTDPEEVQRLQREDAQAWTIADLPLPDTARQRLTERDAMDHVVADLIERSSRPSSGVRRMIACGTHQAFTAQVAGSGPAADL